MSKKRMAKFYSVSAIHIKSNEKINNDYSVAYIKSNEKIYNEIYSLAEKYDFIFEYYEISGKFYLTLMGTEKDEKSFERHLDDLGLFYVKFLGLKNNLDTLINKGVVK